MSNVDTVPTNKRHGDWRGWKFVWPFSCAFIFVFIVPVLYAIWISFYQKPHGWRK